MVATAPREGSSPHKCQQVSPSPRLFTDTRTDAQLGVCSLAGPAGLGRRGSLLALGLCGDTLARTDSPRSAQSLQPGGVRCSIVAGPLGVPGGGRAHPPGRGDRREVRPPAAPPSFLPSVEWGQSKQSNPSQLPGPQPLLTGPCSCPLSPLFPPETGREGGLPHLSVSHLCASFYLQLNRRDCGILSSGPAQRAAFGEKGVPTQ